MLASLENALPTLNSLHTVARLLGALRLLHYGRMPNYLELGLKPKPEGISTDVLPSGGEVTLDFVRLALIHRSAAGSTSAIPLNRQSQAALLETLLQVIYTDELSAVFEHSPGETYTESMFRSVDRFTNRIKPKHDDLSSTAPLAFDAQAAQDYAAALHAIFTGVARFRARLYGAMTPIVVWPEHFDLSFLWFAAEPDEQHPHLNFGFTPYSTGIDYPYLYAYAYPYPAAYSLPQLPVVARWNTEGWTGVVLPYGVIARQTQPELFVEDACEKIYRALHPLLA